MLIKILIPASLFFRTQNQSNWRILVAYSITWNVAIVLLCECGCDVNNCYLLINWSIQGEISVPWRSYLNNSAPNTSWISGWIIEAHIYICVTTEQPHTNIQCHCLEQTQVIIVPNKRWWFRSNHLTKKFKI